MVNLFDTTNLGDPTIEALKKAYEVRHGGRSHSRRLGGSSLDRGCARQLFFSFRWASPVVIGSRGLLAINDGMRSEPVIAAMLRDVPGIELWTKQDGGGQIEFNWLDGHAVGKLDGVVLGILQAPKTPHCWEAKCVNNKKFDNLKSLITKVGEKNALKAWDANYYAQAQCYLAGMKLTRHYLTVATPGVRDLIGVRTDFDPKAWEILEKTARRVVFDDRAPIRVSDDPAFYVCRFCDHNDICHGVTIPQINCRTCGSSSPVIGGGWVCSQHSVELEHEFMKGGCSSHRFHPDFINGNITEVDGMGNVTYTLKDGNPFVDKNKAGLTDKPPNV